MFYPKPLVLPVVLCNRCKQRVGAGSTIRKEIGGWVHYHLFCYKLVVEMEDNKRGGYETSHSTPSG